MMTTYELNKYADQLEEQGMIEESALMEGEAKASPGEIWGKACGIYQKVKPFLEVVVNLFFIPKKWKTPIQTFMVFMDGLCPVV